MQVTCNSVMLMNILSIVKRIMFFVQIIVPILLIVFGTLSFIKMIKNPEEKNGIKRVLNQFLAAAIIFFIPVLINVVMGLVGEKTDFTNCWNEAGDVIQRGSGYQKIDSTKEKSFLPDSRGYEKGKKRTPTGTGTINLSSHQGRGAAAFAAAAREELSDWRSGQTDWRRYKYPFTGPDDTNDSGWCGMFIGYIGGKVGSGAVHWQGDALPAEPTTPRNYHQWYQQNPQAGVIVDNGPGVKPKIGDLVLMWSGSHVEMVENVTTDGFWCIGGGSSVDHNWHEFESDADTWFITPNWEQVQDTSTWDSLIQRWGNPAEE